MQPVMNMIGAIMLILLLLKGINALLLWMDRMDWILIPNKEAALNFDRRLGAALVQIEAVARPELQHQIKLEERKETERDEDEQGAGGPAT